MSTEHDSTKLLRINLLRQLAAAAPMPLPVPRLLTGAKMEGHDVTEKDILRECEFLCDLPDMPMAVRMKEPFSSAVRRYKLLPPGREWLETEGF